MTAVFKTGTVPCLQRTVLPSSSIPHLKKLFSCRLFVYYLKSSFKEAFGQIQTRRTPLKTHRLRYSERTPDIFTCPFCDTNESEIHFLLVCPKYKTLRQTYLPAKFYNRPSAFKVAILLADTRLSFPLAIYISKAFQLRANSISNAILA